VERILERGIAADGSADSAPHDPARAITRNRQPGKCCDTGCTAPGQAVMVDLPVPPSRS
jgi:4-hydroxybutyryl-CoA dehydratase/vinylacetyl-CoA-Delta-isomerase